MNHVPIASSAASRAISDDDSSTTLFTNVAIK